MRVIGKEHLTDFMKRYDRSRRPLRAWLAEVKEEQWETTADLKARYPKASIVNDHYIFDIGGNKFRLDTRVDFERKIVLILRVGTHAQYNDWKFN